MGYHELLYVPLIGFMIGSVGAYTMCTVLGMKTRLRLDYKEVDQEDKKIHLTYDDFIDIAMCFGGIGGATFGLAYCFYKFCKKN